MLVKISERRRGVLILKTPYLGTSLSVFIKTYNNYICIRFYNTYILILSVKKQLLSIASILNIFVPTSK